MLRQGAVLHRPNWNSISKQLFFPLKLEKNKVSCRSLAYFMKKILICLSTSALESLTFKSKPTPLLSELPWHLLFSKVGGAHVFPCAWPLLPCFVLDFPVGFRVLYLFILIANPSNMFCVHSSWWKFLDKAPPPMQTSCFITLKCKSMWCGLERPAYLDSWSM